MEGLSIITLIYTSPQYLMLYMTIWFAVVLRRIIKRQQMQKYNNPNAYDKTHKTLHPIIHEHL